MAAREWCHSLREHRGDSQQRACPLSGRDGLQLLLRLNRIQNPEFGGDHTQRVGDRHFGGSLSFDPLQSCGLVVGWASVRRERVEY